MASSFMSVDRAIEELDRTVLGKVLARIMSGKFLDGDPIKETDTSLSISLSRHEIACASVAFELRKKHAELEAKKKPENKKERQLLLSDALLAEGLMRSSVEKFHDLSKVVRLGVRAGFTLVDMGKLTCPECAGCGMENCPGPVSEDFCGIP